MMRWSSRSRAKVNAIKIGDPSDPKSEMGPVNSGPHFDRINEIIESAKAQGANSLRAVRVRKAAVRTRLLGRTDGLR